jgi:transcriptional regulator with XRE-family HTH domain
MAWHVKLKMALLAAGMDGSKVARRLVDDGIVDQISPQAVNAWLRGENDPDLAPFWAMCRYARVSSDWVLDDQHPARMIPASGPEYLGESAPPPPRALVRQVKPKPKGADPPHPEASGKRGGPRPPRPSRGKADVDLD